IRLASFAVLFVVWPLHGYVLNLGDTRQLLHWELNTPVSFVPTNSVNTNTHAIRFYLASDAYSATNTAAELNAVRAAIGQWRAVSNTFYKFEEAGYVNPPLDVSLTDHTNIIY